MSRDIDDLRHPERCPTCGSNRPEMRKHQHSDRYGIGWHDHPPLQGDAGKEHEADAFRCPDPFHDTPTPSLPPEVEEAELRSNLEGRTHVYASDRLTAIKLLDTIATLRSRITSQAEEIERLRRERPRIPSNGHAMLDLLDERDEWKARAEWLAGRLADFSPWTSEAMLTASLKVVREGSR